MPPALPAEKKALPPTPGRPRSAAPDGATTARPDASPSPAAAPNAVSSSTPPFAQPSGRIGAAATITPSAPPSEVAGAQTLRRGLSVLRLLTRIGPGGLRMGDIGRRLALNKATAIRLTRTLVEEGFVLHDRASGRYRLGPEAFAVGLAAEPSYELQRLSAATLRSLALESGDTVFFSVLHGYESICLSRNEGDFPIRNQLIKPGDRWPLGVGAGACAMLAALSDPEVTDVLARNAGLRAEKFPRCTDEAILQLVRQARLKGYCVQPGLVIEGSWAVGVPVFDANNRPVASISIAAIESRLGTARAATLGNRLMQASQELTALQKAPTAAHFV